MSESNEKNQNADEVKLNALFAFKQGMATVWTDQGEAVPVTVLKYEPWVVSQVKTKSKDGYSSVKLASKPKKAKNSKKAVVGQLKKSGFENGAFFMREVRHDGVDSILPGQRLSISSLSKGDIVKVTGVSKGKGFQGAVKRHGFAGGPAAHGSKFHRQPGSMGNRTWPQRVMPGKRLPGHMGNKKISVKNLTIVDINENENVILVKGAVPGARNSLLMLVKE